ncbi:hypothetical protein SAMN02745126_04462 [Enhydrobacter aerosaccus]|uniref:Uncharacterized protein n=1 Tax=Enhydrobacter aerosaccus TaxID=225324 RepID=A0A1T4S9J8_9HYPH|nr:hypothetical protein SAMN02745126_04462 [Enhydrobacter aerosaccus]
MEIHAGIPTAEIEIRPDLSHVLDAAWARIGAPGTWWNAAERVAIAAETRQAVHCDFCRARREAVSASMVSGRHDNAVGLPSPAIEAIHRIRTDPGRLGRGWYDSVITAGLSEECYVEMVSVIAVVVANDTFRRAAGLPALALPRALPGEATRRRPAGAKPGLAWMPTLAPEDRTADDPDLYQDHPGPRQRGGGNVHRALSLVPDSMLHWWDMFEIMYLPAAAMRDFTREYRAISHAQIEMLAARVAALNQCIY